MNFKNAWKVFCENVKRVFNKTHLHAWSRDVAKLDGDAQAFQDHGDSVLRVLDLVQREKKVRNKLQTFLEVSFDDKENYEVKHKCCYPSWKLEKMTILR